MIGCRPLTDTEIDQLKVHPTLSTRDRVLLVVGALTGFRVGELRTLQVQDIALGKATVRRRNMKGKDRSRTITLHPEALAAIEALVYEQKLGPTSYLFQSQKGPNKPISARHAHRVLSAAFKELGLEGKVATHSMRKYFAGQVYEKSGKDIALTANMLGHRNVNSTLSYLSFQTETADALILNMRRK